MHMLAAESSSMTEEDEPILKSSTKSFTSSMDYMFRMAAEDERILTSSARPPASSPVMDPKEPKSSEPLESDSDDEQDDSSTWPHHFDIWPHPRFTGCDVLPSMPEESASDVDECGLSDGEDKSDKCHRSTDPCESWEHEEDEPDESYCSAEECESLDGGEDHSDSDESYFSVEGWESLEAGEDDSDGDASGDSSAPKVYAAPDLSRNPPRFMDTLCTVSSDDAAQSCAKDSAVAALASSKVPESPEVQSIVNSRETFEACRNLFGARARSRPRPSLSSTPLSWSAGYPPTEQEAPSQVAGLLLRPGDARLCQIDWLDEQLFISMRRDEEELAYEEGSAYDSENVGGELHVHQVWRLPTSFNSLQRAGSFSRSLSPLKTLARTTRHSNFPWRPSAVI